MSSGSILNSAADEACDLIRALAHPARLRIVCALSGRECCDEAGGNRRGSDLGHFAPSRLAAQGPDRQGAACRQTVFYSLCDAKIGKFVAVLAETFCASRPANRNERKA